MRNTFMPELNALERRVKKLCNMPVIYSDPKKLLEALEQGEITASILKPSDSQVINSMKKMKRKNPLRLAGFETTRQVNRIASQSSGLDEASSYQIRAS